MKGTRSSRNKDKFDKGENPPDNQKDLHSTNSEDQGHHGDAVNKTPRNCSKAGKRKTKLAKEMKPK